MWNTFHLILPIFGLALIGYAARWIGLIDKDGIRGLSGFAFRVAIPVMLIRAVSEISLTFEWELLTAYFGGTFAIYATGMLVGRGIFGPSIEQQAVFGFGAAFSNLVMVGIPFVQLAFGDEGLLPLYLILSIHSPTLYLVGTSVLNLGRGARSSSGNLPMTVLKAQAKNPIVIALAIGIAMNLAGIRFQGPVDGMAAMMGAAAIPCTLFTLGASLAGYGLGGQLKAAIVLVALKERIAPHRHVRSDVLRIRLESLLGNGGGCDVRSSNGHERLPVRRGFGNDCSDHGGSSRSVVRDLGGFPAPCFLPGHVTPAESVSRRSRAAANDKQARISSVVSEGKSARIRSLVSFLRQDTPRRRIP